MQFRNKHVRSIGLGKNISSSINMIDHSLQRNYFGEISNIWSRTNIYRIQFLNESLFITNCSCIAQSHT